MNFLSFSGRTTAAIIVGVTALLSASACGTGGSGSDGGSTADGGPPDGGGVTYEITPENPSLVAQNGSADVIGFSLFANDNGTREAVEATWSILPSSFGAIDASTGEFTANGLVAGTATVRARLASGSVATTTVSIQLDNTQLGDGVSADVPALFDPEPTIGGPEAPALLYPLDEALIPTSLKAPNVQWEGGVEGDFYRIKVGAGLATTTAYVAHSGASFNYASAVHDASWQAVTREGLNSPLSITVDRFASATSQTFRSATHELEVASATLDGAIYYWDLTDGKILRITKDGREDFLPSPPPVGGKRCVACHTMSRDGKQMAGVLGDAFYQGGAILSLEDDLSADPAPTTVAPGTYAALFSTFNPDATRLMVNATSVDPGTSDTHSKLVLVDTDNGDILPTAGAPLPQDGAAHPTWSPDGAQIAYIANHNGPLWAADFTEGDLAVIPVTGPDAFGATQVLRTADGKANAWPTFSPDSEWIAYGRGAHSRGRNDGAGEVYPGSLRLMHRDGGEEFVLANANGTGENTHLPNFSPFEEGGYFWLAFYSTRAYGNEEAGTKGKDLRQLWITAIATDPQSGQDPSHVPYWLPDQDVTTHNMSGYWTLPPPIGVR